MHVFLYFSWIGGVGEPRSLVARRAVVVAGGAMTVQRRLAQAVARTPVHHLLGRAASFLNRYIDASENYNDFDSASNGEDHLIAHAAPHWSVVLDVGANVGVWAQSVLQANPCCTLHAFEPSPTTFATLRRRLGGRAGVKLHNVGVGAEPGRLRYHDYGADSPASSFHSRALTTGAAPQRIVELQVVPLDEVLGSEDLRRVDFVKIDTEGFELPVLRGLTSALRARTVMGLQFEYGGTWIDAGTFLGVACGLLETHGYVLYRLFPHGVRRFRYEALRDETYKYANYVAVADDATVEKWGLARV
jgi:FkbM family methyltransferase